MFQRERGGRKPKRNAPRLGFIVTEKLLKALYQLHRAESKLQMVKNKTGKEKPRQSARLKGRIVLNINFVYRTRSQ